MDLWHGGRHLLTQLFCAGKGIYNFVRKIDYDSNSLLTILNYLFTIKSFFNFYLLIFHLSRLVQVHNRQHHMPRIHLGSASPPA